MGFFGLLLGTALGVSAVNDTIENAKRKGNTKLTSNGIEYYTDINGKHRRCSDNREIFWVSRVYDTEKIMDVKGNVLLDREAEQYKKYLRHINSLQPIGDEIAPKGKYELYLIPAPCTYSEFCYVDSENDKIVSTIEDYYCIEDRCVKYRLVYADKSFYEYNKNFKPKIGNTIYLQYRGGEKMDISKERYDLIRKQVSLIRSEAWGKYKYRIEEIRKEYR